MPVRTDVRTSVRGRCADATLHFMEPVRREWNSPKSVMQRVCFFCTLLVSDQSEPLGAVVVTSVQSLSMVASR